MPAANSQPDAGETPNEVSPAANIVASACPDPGVPPRRVLIVEDSRVVQQRLVGLVAGVPQVRIVGVAEDGHQARKLFRQQRPDAVILDIALPGSSGLELLTVFKREQPACVVILLTTYAFKELRQRCALLGADYFFDKATEFERVTAVLATLSARHLLAPPTMNAPTSQENLECQVAEHSAQLHVSEPLARSLARLYQGALDALSEHICVIAADGTILAVNAPWRSFVSQLRLPNGPVDLGSNYFKAVSGLLDAPPATGAAVLAGVQAVVRGERVEFSMEYECGPHRPERWFLLRATCFGSGQPERTVVTQGDITQRKRASQFLYDSEEKYRLLVEHTPEVVWRADPARSVLFISGSAARVFGYTPQELYGASGQLWAARIHPNDAPRVQAAYASLFEAATTYDVEYRYERADGIWVWLHDRAVAVSQKQGIRYADGLVGDISARKKAAADLQHQHDLYRGAIMAANAIPYQRDYLQDRYVFMGEGIKDLLGYAPEELTASVWKTIILESVVTGDAAGLTMAEAGQRAVAGQLKNWRADYRVLTRSGEVRWIADSSISLLDADGRYTGSLGIIQDITDRRRAEDQLRKLGRAVEQSPVAILITDRRGRIEFVNPKFTQITGYTAAEVLRHNPRLLKSGETQPSEYRRLWETISSGQEWRGEFHNKRKDGTLYWESASISPMRNSRGEITHFIAMKEDVTEQKLTQAKLLRAQRVESIGSLASGIAHDLNNILTPIVMCAPMLTAEDAALDQHELAQTIETSAQRAVGVVKQLLSFARGKESAKLPVQMRHLVRDMAKIARETFPRSIQIEDACAANLWPVLADATQLHQVILNLCVNARDAMPEGGRLRLRASNVTLDDHSVALYPEACPGPYVRLVVEDTGAGIPKDIQGHIFESFFTTKGEDQGTGLGLTTVQGIVKDHRGFITFTSTPRQGTAFEIHLPALPDLKTATAEADPPASELRGQGQLILVVDDEPAICKATCHTLEHHGYTVIQADNGTEGLARFTARQHEIRAVICDVMMPLMDGVTFCRALRALAPQIPLIVASGGLFDKAGTEALRAFAEMGIRHILHKPHNGELLLQKLQQVLQTRAQQAPQGGT